MTTRRLHVGIAVGGFIGQFVLFASLLIAVAVQASLLPPPTNVLGIVRAFGAETTLWEAGGLLVTSASRGMFVRALLMSLAAITGGYLAARISRERPLLVGMLSSWQLLGLALVVVLRTAHSLADFRTALLLGLLPAMGALGGSVTRSRFLLRRLGLAAGSGTREF